MPYIKPFVGVVLCHRCRHVVHSFSGGHSFSLVTLPTIYFGKCVGPSPCVSMGETIEILINGRYWWPEDKLRNMKLQPNSKYYRKIMHSGFSPAKEYDGLY